MKNPGSVTASNPSTYLYSIQVQYAINIGGMRDLLGRVCSLMAGEMPQLWCRAELSEVVAEQTDLGVNGVCYEQTLLLNGRGLWRALPA